MSNLATGTNTLVSATPDGMLSSGFVLNQPFFSPNGQYLAYPSTAVDLTANALEAAPLRSRAIRRMRQVLVKLTSTTFSSAISRQARRRLPRQRPVASSRARVPRGSFSVPTVSRSSI